MQNYKDLLEKVSMLGRPRTSRAGDTLGLFGEVLRFPNVSLDFPAITIRKLRFNSVAGELAGFLRAERDASRMGSSIWLEDAKRWSGGTDMGRIYGSQWRDWKTSRGAIDQLRRVVNKLKTDPYDRRLVVSAWNPGEEHLMCLPPCHYAFQFHVQDGALNCMAHMRSVDCYLGLPFDIASYALLMHIVANEVDLVPKQLTMTLGDTHIYKNHFSQVDELLSRHCFDSPMLRLNPEATIDNFTTDMFKLVNYRYHPALSAPLNVG